MRRSSPTSAGATYLDRGRRLDDLRAAAERAASVLSSIERVVLFGSVVTGTPTPSSDADLLVVVRSSAHARRRDRIPEMLRALAPLPCPVDLFVLTVDEVARAGREGAPLVRTALRTGVDLIDGAPRVAESPRNRK